MTSSDTLQTRLKKLNPDETRILMALAVLYQPINQTQTKQFLTLLGWKDRQGRSLDGLIAKPLREKLQKTQLLLPLQSQWACHQNIAEVLARMAVAEGLYKSIAQAAQRIVPYTKPHYYAPRPSEREMLRRLRDALYGGDTEQLFRLLEVQSPYQDYYPPSVDNLAAICIHPFSPAWFERQPESIQYAVLNRLQYDQNGSGNQWFEYLQHHVQAGSLKHPAFSQLLAGWSLERGQVAGVETLLARNDSWQTRIYRGWLAFLQGDYTAAIDCYSAALAIQRKETRKRNVFIDGMEGVFFLLALMRSQEPQHRQLLDKQLAIAVKNGGDFFRNPFFIISEVTEVLRGTKQVGQSLLLNRSGPSSIGEMNLLNCLALHWLGETPPESLLKQLAKDAVAAHKEGYKWFAYEGAALLQQYEFTSNKINGLAALLKHDRSDAEFVSILYLIRPQASWERALQALQAVNGAATASTGAQATHEPDTRLVWWLEGGRGHYYLQPREQKRAKSGTWSKGRPVALKRLHENIDEIAGATAQDRLICQYIRRRYGFGYYGGTEYYIDDNALLAAEGHPHVYWADAPDTPVEIIRGQPELLVRQEKKQLSLQLLPTLEADTDEDEHGPVVQREGSHRLRLITFTREHYQIARILGPKGLKVPLAAREQVLESIGAIAPLLTVQSDIGGGDSAGATEVAPDPRLHVHIQPAGSALKFNCYVQPLAGAGPLFRPGEGGSTVFAEIEGKRLHTTRDLDVERNACDRLLAQCPALQASAWETDGTPWEWLLEEGQALEALYQLQECGNQVEMAWPQGGRLQLRRETEIGHMQVSVRRERDWFALDGELRLGEDQVLSLEHLLELLGNSPGRFIRLGEDQFLTLTRQLYQRLEALRSHGNRRRFHPLAAGALDELTDGMEVSADKPWQTQLERLREAHQQQPEVPATLRAELRDYQREGFQWLARLAHWGAGACLADDMGLGKTLQSLALILSRAAQGPSLILAPTSVCMNWLEEATRFAPTLRPLRFGTGDRQAMLDAAGPFDLIVCSYGLLQTEAERLSKVEWHTVVADEAQALKNPHAKRSKAALGLPGAFKMIATGTPIENHLGELWSLFQFINPGLLGSLESFNQRFAGPIENRQDTAAKQQLKRLVRPFILRRLKSDVLTELPARTEITLRVPFSDEEAAFYEALRRRALEKLAETVASPAQQRVKVLAEIMRLRRACCNPRLVMPGCEIPSAKLQAFGGILDELLDNRHRALVFSQFVDHLTLLREYLDGRGIRYQYLDGGTPVKQRQAAVQAFQAGEGELFLISLKAGGAGLNLTAADYVVHMDPWWNPAVEDQASDRAHRLGQQRPVTIYRLVAENTIEDKIVDLHHHKRDLADSLLEGSEVSGKLSLDEIVSLMGGT